MKKFLIKFLCLTLTIVSAFSLIACDPQENNGGNTQTYVNTHENFDDFESRFGEYVDTTANRSTITETETVLYDKNSSSVCDYQIVISSNEYSSTSEFRAATEIQTFMLEVTGKKLPIVYDNDAQFIESNSVNGVLEIDSNKKLSNAPFSSNGIIKSNNSESN